MKMSLSNENCPSLVKPSNSLQNEKDYLYDKIHEKENHPNDTTDYEEEAKWDNLLSDTSDSEG